MTKHDVEEPCCCLWKQRYPQDHEYMCPKRVKAEGREWKAPSDA